jgi:hypothetical protein
MRPREARPPGKRRYTTIWGVAREWGDKKISKVPPRATSRSRDTGVAWGDDADARRGRLPVGDEPGRRCNCLSLLRLHPGRLVAVSRISRAHSTGIPKSRGAAVRAVTCGHGLTHHGSDGEGRR